MDALFESRDPFVFCYTLFGSRELKYNCNVAPLGLLHLTFMCIKPRLLLYHLGFIGVGFCSHLLELIILFPALPGL